MEKPVDFFLKYGMLIMCAEGTYGYTMRFFFAKDEKTDHFLRKNPGVWGHAFGNLHYYFRRACNGKMGVSF